MDESYNYKNEKENPKKKKNRGLLEVHFIYYPVVYLEERNGRILSALLLLMPFLWWQTKWLLGKKEIANLSLDDFLHIGGLGKVWLIRENWFHGPLLIVVLWTEWR